MYCIYALLRRYFRFRVCSVLFVRPADFLRRFIILSCVLFRIIGDLLVTLWILHRLTEMKREDGRDRDSEEKWWRTDRPGCPTSYRTGSMQVISLRISIFLLWFETCFIATYYRRMGSRLRGQQPRMATLRPSVGERSLTTELVEPSHEKPTPKIGSGGNDYGNVDIEMWVSRKTEIREDLRSSRRKRCDPVEFRALERKMRRWHDSRSLQDPAPIRRDNCGDSDHCMLPEDSAPGTCAVASERVALRKDAGRKKKLRRASLRSDGRITGVRRTSYNCKVANFREARIVSLSDFPRWLVVRFGRVTFRV